VSTLRASKVPGSTAVPGAVFEGTEEPRRAGTHDRLLGQPDHALRHGAVRQRQETDHAHDQGQAGQRRAPDPAAAFTRLGHGRQRLQRLAHRDDRHHDHGPDRQQHAEEEELGADEDGDGQRNEHPVDRRGDAVAAEPQPFGQRLRRRFHVAQPQQVALDQVGPIAGGPLAEVGHLDDVRQDVVGVVAQQRIAIEQQCRHTRHHHHIETERTGQAGLDRQPQIEGERSQEQLHHHSGRTDQRAPPAGPEHRGRRCVDIRHGHEHQQHHAHVVHLAARRTRCRRMAKLVQGLDQRKHDGDQQQVVGLQHAIGQVVREFGPVLRHQKQRRQHDGEP
jgi:hypothetical protein